MGYIFDLMLSESLAGHEVSQIGNVKLLVKNFLGDWPDLVDLLDSVHEVCLLLPHLERITHPSRYHVADHGFLLLLSGYSAEDLPSCVHVVEMKPVNIDLVERVAQLLRSSVLKSTVGILFRLVKVFDHLEARHDASVVKLLGNVGEAEDQRLVPLVLAHHRAETSSLVDLGLQS